MNEGQGVPVSDKRGKHNNHRRLDDARLQGVIQYIDSFPKYESHYTRSHQVSRKYLSPDLTVAKMYELYTEKCEEKGEEPLKEWVTKFNLSFHPPRKDTCKTCDVLKIKIDAAADDGQKTALKTELELHHRKAEKIRESL